MKHLESDDSVILQISFNGFDFITVSNKVTLTQDVVVRPSLKKFKLFTPAPIYSDILALQGITNTCPVVTAEQGQAF
jgi:hypothetical protein